MNDLVSVKEADFLDQDPPIRGQKYVCLSFISPEDVIKQKDAYFFERFINWFSRDLDELFRNSKATYKEQEDFMNGLQAIEERYSYLFDTTRIQEEFEFYKTQNIEELEEDYLQKNNFQTTMRGIKVRGSYETVKEAQIRAQVLKRMDDKFNVYIAEVGCWCPWSPNPEELENQEFAETHLNTLMKQYRENQELKDEFYAKRKDIMVQEQMKKVDAAKAKEDEERKVWKAEEEKERKAREEREEQERLKRESEVKENDVKDVKDVNDVNDVKDVKEGEVTEESIDITAEIEKDTWLDRKEEEKRDLEQKASGNVLPNSNE